MMWLQSFGTSKGVTVAKHRRDDSTQYQYRASVIITRIEDEKEAENND